MPRGKDTKQLVVYLEQKDLDRIKAMAKDRGVSASKWVRQLVEKESLQHSE